MCRNNHISNYKDTLYGSFALFIDEENGIPEILKCFYNSSFSYSTKAKSFKLWEIIGHSNYYITTKF